MATYNQTLLTGQGMAYNEDQTAGKAYTAVHHEITRAIIEQSEKDDKHSKEAIEALKALKEELKQAAIANKDTRLRDLPSGVRGQFTDVSKTIQQLTRELPSKQDWQNFKNDLDPKGFKYLGAPNTAKGTAAQLAAGAVGSAFGVGGEAQFVVKAIQESTEALREVYTVAKFLTKTTVEGIKKTGDALGTIGSFFDPRNPQGITGRLISGLSNILSGQSFLTPLLEGIAAIIPKFLPLRTTIPGVDTALLIYDLIQKVQEKFPDSFQLPKLNQQTLIDLLNKIIPGTTGDSSTGPRSDLGRGASPVKFTDAGGMSLLSGGFGGTQSQIQQDERLIQFLGMQEQQNIANAGRPQLAAYHPSSNPYGDPRGGLTSPDDQGTGMPTSSGGRQGPFRPGVIPSILGLLSSRRRHGAQRGLGKFNQGFPPNAFKGFFRRGGLIPPGGVGVVGEDGAEGIEATPSGVMVTPTLRSRLGGRASGITNATPVPTATPAPEGGIKESLRSLRTSSSPLRPLFSDPLPQTFEATDPTIYYTGPEKTGGVKTKSVTYTDPQTGATYTDRTPPIGPPSSGLPSETPGIAFGFRNFPKHGRETLGGYYLVTPKGGVNAGESYILPHSDMGPGAGHGERLDYNAPAANMVFGSMKESALQGGAYVRYVGETLPEGVFAGKQPSEGIGEKYQLSPGHSQFIQQKLSVPLPRERPDDIPQVAGIPQGVMPIAGSKGQPGQLTNVPSSSLGRELGVGDVGKGKPWPVVSTQKLLEKEARAGGFGAAISSMGPGGKYSEDPIDWTSKVKNADVSNIGPQSENIEDRRGERFRGEPRWLAQKRMNEQAIKASGLNIEKIRKEGEKHDLEVKGGGPKASDHQQDIHRLKNERDDAKRAANERQHQDRQQSRRQQNRPNVPVHRPQRVVGDFHLAMLTSGNPSG